MFINNKEIKYTDLMKSSSIELKHLRKWCNDELNQRKEEKKKERWMCMKCNETYIKYDDAFNCCRKYSSKSKIKREE